MSTTDTDGADRRAFLRLAGAATATAAIPIRSSAAPEQEETPPPPPPPADAEPPRGITRATIAEAEKLAAVAYTDRERDVIVDSIGEQIDRFAALRDTPLSNDDATAQTFVVPRPAGDRPDGLRRSTTDPGPLPGDDVDIAFAPVTHLARWIERREVTSRRLTEIYLDRLERLGPELECVVTLTPDLARAQAARADREIADGNYRGPLHGIPWGAKDLLDTAGVRTTWGATPYKDRVVTRDAVVVQRLAEAGAVLTAKLTLGALAYGDIWFGGRTRNPWDLEEGSSGSSAGSASATASGLVGFSIGTETYGSIVSPCMRCGTTGLRPTFGRVARTGAMALCWSLDKIGPICRTVEDTALVLHAINGADAGDPSSVDAPFDFDAEAPLRGVRVGFDPAWFEDAHDLDRAALAAARQEGLELVEIDLPDWPYDSLLTILLAEAAAAFEELTLSSRDDALVWQEPQAWPNTFRAARFISAVDYVQAERFRRRVGAMMDERFERVDAILAPSYAASLLLITNNTGHPALVLRSGLEADGTPRGVTLMGRPFDEGTLCRLGMALERRLNVWRLRPARDRRPPG